MAGRHDRFRPDSRMASSGLSLVPVNRGNLPPGDDVFVGGNFTWQIEQTILCRAAVVDFSLLALYVAKFAYH